MEEFEQSPSDVELPHCPVKESDRNSASDLVAIVSDDNAESLRAEIVNGTNCLERFVDEDLISSSHNANCDHVFHRDCILQWLLTHDDRPCRRRNFEDS